MAQGGTRQSTSRLSPTREFPPASYKPGEIIFSAGDKSDNMYVIRTGEVEVEVERDGKIVETLSAGGIFGEMAL